MILEDSYITIWNVPVVAVSIDDEKTKNAVSTYVNGKAWEFEVLIVHPLIDGEPPLLKLLET